MPGDRFPVQARHHTIKHDAQMKPLSIQREKYATAPAHVLDSLVGLVLNGTEVEPENRALLFHDVSIGIHKLGEDDLLRREEILGGERELWRVVMRTG